MITIVHVTNPLQPSTDRKSYHLPFFEGRHLDEYLLEIFSACDHMTVSVNGGIIPADLWFGVLLRDGDYIVASPTVAGGNILRTLASVAVLAAAAVVTSGASLTLAGFTLGFTGLQLGATASALVSGAISLGGNLLIGALMGNTPSSKTNSASYDPDGPRSLARSGTVIPKGAGTMNWGGNTIASFTDLEGEDQYINVLNCYGFGPARAINQIQINGKDISTYQNVQVYTRLGTNNQTPIPNFNRVVNGYPQDVQCLAGQPVVVPGTGTQTQILQVDVMFPDGVFVLTSDNNLIPAVITYLVEYSVSGANNWQPVVMPYTTSDVVSYNANGTPIYPHAWSVIATDLPPNSGVVYYMDDGPHSPGDSWTGTIPCTVFQPNGNYSTYNKQCTGEWQRTNGSINQVLVTGWRAGYQDFVGCDRQPLYNRTNIYGLAPGKYDVRVTKYGSARLHDNVSPGDNNSSTIGQQVWIHSVNEVSLIDLAYPNMILIGVRALATNQLSGSSLNLTATITHGLRTVDNNILPSALQAYEEDDPACVAADAMLDGLYGGGQFPGVVPANINRYIDEWVSWANLNDSLVDDGNGGSIRRHVFNGVFDTEGSLWDAITAIGRMSRAAVIPLGRDYGVFVDQPDVPVQMFSMGNILQDSFQESWLEIDSRANQVEIEFADSTRYWKQDNPLVYMDSSDQNSGAIIKNVRLNGKGVTIPAQAWHMARFKQRSTKYLLRSGSFKVDADAVACRPGNVAILQHDVPQWGWGGRLLIGSTTSILQLDRTDIPFTQGISYNVIVLHAAVLRYSGTISSITPLVDATGASTGTQVQLSNFDGAYRVTRFVLPGGSDSPIASYSAGTVVIQPTAGFAGVVGEAYQLFDTDVLDVQPVSGVKISGQTCSITLASPLLQAPRDFSTYFYGPIGSQKLIRVTNVKKSSDLRATIEWIDYSDQVYIDGTPVLGSTSLQQTSNPGVTRLTGNEDFQYIAGSYVGFARLAWKLGPDTAGVGIYGAILGGNTATANGLPTLLARLTNTPTSWQTQVTPGITWQYTVVGFDSNGHYAGFASAPTITIAAVGIAKNLLLGSNFASGFAYWSRQVRNGDTFLTDFQDDGRAVYTVNGSTLATPQQLLVQTVPAAKWAVGDYLMLSSYFADYVGTTLGAGKIRPESQSTTSGASSNSGPNIGQMGASLVYYDASGKVLTSTTCAYTLSGTHPALVRVNTPPVLVPAGTATIIVDLAVLAPPGAGTSTPPTVVGGLEAGTNWIQAGTTGNSYGSTATGTFIRTAASSAGADSTFSAAGNAPYADGYWYMNLGSYDSMIEFSYALEIMFPTAQDLANCQAVEFELQQSVGGLIFNMAWQADLKGSGNWRYFTYTNTSSADWHQPSPAIPVNTSLFAPGQYVSIVANFRRDPAANTMTHVSLSINGTVYAVNVTQPATSQPESDYVHAAFQLDCSGASTPPQYIVHVTDMNVTMSDGTTSAGGSVSIPVGSALTASHLLLEVCASPTQSSPSAWADMDASGHVLDLFNGGLSTGLRVQGSVLPSFTGNFSYTSSSINSNGVVTISWTGLVILWPDGSFTYVQDGNFAVGGLTPSTTYYAFLYFDIVRGGVYPQVPSSPVGGPALLSATYDVLADAACSQDNRVPLTKGGMQVTTPAAGSSGNSGSGPTGPSNGTGGTPTPVPPSSPTCTVRGTVLPTAAGPMSNEEVKERFDRGEPICLMGRGGPERIAWAKWAPVEDYYSIQIDGFSSFGASESMTLAVEGGEHVWCSRIPTGTLVDTVSGYRTMHRERVDASAEVLFIELEGPSHEYQVVEGVWTHNIFKVYQGPSTA